MVLILPGVSLIPPTSLECTRSRKDIGSKHLGWKLRKGNHRTEALAKGTPSLDGARLDCDIKSRLRFEAIPASRSILPVLQAAAPTPPSWPVKPSYPVVLFVPNNTEGNTTFCCCYAYLSGKHCTSQTSNVWPVLVYIYPKCT